MSVVGAVRRSRVELVSYRKSQTLGDEGGVVGFSETQTRTLWN